MKLATLCYLRKNGKTLMLHRNKKENDMHEGKWNGLGGKFLPGETPEQCARREIKEECGLDVKELNLRGFITFPLFDGKNDWYCFLFTSENPHGDFVDSPEGELKWVDDEKLLDLNLWEGDKIFLKWLNQNRFFSAIFIYENGRLVEHSVTFY